MGAVITIVISTAVVTDGVVAVVPGVIGGVVAVPALLRVR